MASMPVPPIELQQRVGEFSSEDPREYERWGAVGHDLVVGALPDDWSWDGKRVLDFGCGAGRVLRHMAARHPQARFWGCDLDGPSIAWLADQHGDVVTAVQNGERPPIPSIDGPFDLIYAISVFTHLTTEWASWLAELHRLLGENGILVATWLGPVAFEHYAGPITDRSYDPDQIGMTVVRWGEDWDAGGPFVFHSRWWLEAHWGRAFELYHWDICRPEEEMRQSVVAGRRRPVDVTRQTLEAIEPGESREVLALAENLEMVHAETALLRRWGRDQAEHAARVEAWARDVADHARQLERSKRHTPRD
jgi:SAM-dependent methyltransferase